MRIQAEPRLIDAGDMPDVERQRYNPPPYPFQAFSDALDEVDPPTPPETPKEMHRHLLTEAHDRAVTASENAYEACDWLRLLDPTTADKYRTSATRLFELSEHLAVLLEES